MISWAARLFVIQSRATLRAASLLGPLLCFVVPPVNAAVRSANSGSYCGIGCIYAAARLFNRPTHYEDLVQQQYISSDDGSTVADLCAAAHSAGLQAFPSHLTISELESLPLPAIAHTRGDTTTNEFNHWILITRADANSIDLLDPDAGCRTLAPADLAAVWDGNVVLVSLRAPTKGEFYRATLMSRGWWLGTALILIFALKIGKASYLSLSGRSEMVQCAAGIVAITLLAALLATVVHAKGATGMLSHPSAVQSIQSAYETSFLPKLKKREVENIVREHRIDSVVVDCRKREDFQAGHIDGALNIPVDIDRTLLSSCESALPRSRKLVLYCQSSGCPFTSRVARRLLNDNDRNIYIYSGGWVDWQSVASVP